MGDFAPDGLDSRSLQTDALMRSGRGYVATVEPGLYFSAGDETIPEAFRGIGIRIEDDIHITGGEPEILTSATVKTIADVEEACASERLAPPMLETERVTS